MIFTASPLIFTTSSFGAPVLNKSSTADPKTECKATNLVQLTDVTETASPGSIGLVNDYGATICGQYDNNDKPDPTQNIGYLNDGFMNATESYIDSLNGANSIDGYSFTDFIYPPLLLQTLGKGDNEPAGTDGTEQNDPGWLQLGKMDVANQFDYSSVNGTSLAGLVTVSVMDFGTNSGLWTLCVDEDAVNNAEAILGRPAKFDHLAIVLKRASGLAIYDFNFLDIFSLEALDGNNVFNFEPPYTLSGSWDTSELISQGGNESALSHFSMWVRDPII